MPFVRREVRTLGGKWNDTLLWYARAVGVLKERPIANPTSWYFLAAIHGFHPMVWEQFGFISSATQLPSNAVQNQYWLQCQHQSWYFLPWHRGYLYAFEKIVRNVIVSEGGPDDWALPYWNYSKKDVSARTLPDEFGEPALPDGSPNHLFVPRRYGAGAVPIEIPAPSVSLRALDSTTFTGGQTDIPPGFGGPATAFHHGPEDLGTNGAIESLPHNDVHGALGGAKPGTDPNQWWNLGLMSMPITAALDPIFWLHHANIDRLWSVWLSIGANANSPDPVWLDGPVGRRFIMPLSDDSNWDYATRDVLQTRAAPLDYYYDDEAPPEVPSRVSRRLASIGIRRVAGAELHPVQEVSVSEQTRPALVGASDGEVQVAGRTRAQIRLDDVGMASLRTTLARAATGVDPVRREPPRVFLKLEGIRGTADAAVYYVYVNLPTDADPADYPDRLAGSISLFGVTAATDRNGPMAGMGINEVFEITEIVDAMHLSGDDLTKLDVQLVPSNAIGEASRFAIAQMSVYKLGD